MKLTSSFQRALSSFQRPLSYLPLVWIALFILFVCRVYIKLGYMPQFENPDPKSLGFDIHHGLLFFNLFSVFGSLPVWIILSIILAAKNKKNIYLLDVIIYIVGYLFIFLFFKFDILGLSNWFGD